LKGIILLNGEPYAGLEEDKDALVYCCDGAYLWAAGKTHIDENIGDFDSLDIKPYPEPKKIYPEEKDFTDGEIALRQMLLNGVDEIIFYGAGGKREDHFLGNINLLYYAFVNGVKAEIITNYSEMQFASDKFFARGVKGKTVSLIPFMGDAVVTGSRGLHYPLDDLTIRAGTCLGISNKADEEDIFFEVKKGVLLVCIDKKKKGEEGG